MEIGNQPAFKGICTATTMCKFKFRNVCEKKKYIHITNVTCMWYGVVAANLVNMKISSFKVLQVTCTFM